MIPTAELREEIKRMADLVPWYHRFEFPDGTVIPGWEGIYPIWEMIRKVRDRIYYPGKRVLDLASRDGMWAFEAEKLDAETVLATDIGCDGYREHIMFVKSVLKSKVGIYFNVPTEDAFNRLDVWFQGNPGLFDVVQHLGLLYHLENPMASLRSTRKCLEPGGKLLLETAYFRTPGARLPMALFNGKSDIYTDPNTYWAFNIEALYSILNATGFIVEGKPEYVDQSENIGRVCLVATAI